MYSTRSYVKANGKVGYELYNTLTDEVLFKDENFQKVKDVKTQLEIDESLEGKQ